MECAVIINVFCLLRNSCHYSTGLLQIVYDAETVFGHLFPKSAKNALHWRTHSDFRTIQISGSLAVDHVVS